MPDDIQDVIVIGGGLAGLSAAIYLVRNRTQTLVIDSGHSMAVWEPEVQNYLGFPEGLSGVELLERGRAQAARFGATFMKDEVLSVSCEQDDPGDSRGPFQVEGRDGLYRARRLLFATGLTHLPPEIPGVRECLGKSLFFCKDCDAVRAQGGRIAIIGRNNEVVEYALTMLRFSPEVMIALNGKEPTWDRAHDAWLKEYRIPVREARIVEIHHDRGQLKAMGFETGEHVPIDYAFTTRGDVPHNRLAKSLGAELDEQGQVIVDQEMSTSVRGVYAAGCVTPSNCQMIIAAGEGAIAAQAINRDLFEESLRTHALTELSTNKK